MLLNKTVFVTGAGGYIGRHVVKALLDLGVSVSTVEYSNKDIDNRVKVYKANIFDDDENIFETLGRPDVCLHMAWKDGFVHNSDLHLRNLYQHYKFLKNMIDSGLSHLTVMGTMHEIGYYVGEINEDTQTNPHSLYGIAKNSLRQSLEIYTSNKAVTFQWLRAFYIYGDDINSNSVFSKIIQAENERKDTFPFTSGRNMYDFILVSELARQIAFCVLQNDINGIINCCSGNAVALREVVESFLLQKQFEIKLEYGAYPDRSYDSPAVWGNNDKIQSIITARELLEQELKHVFD